MLAQQTRTTNYAMRTLIFFLSTFLVVTHTSGQGIESLHLEKPVGNSAMNTLSFSLPAQKVIQLHEAKGEKLALNTPFIVVNRDTLVVKEIRVRGTSSSYLRRKSLNIKLKNKAHFNINKDTFSLRRFYAISMNMDKNYIRNSMSYAVLGRMDIQIPHNCYANLTINDVSEGLYMIFDPPEQFALERCGADVVIRRGYNHMIDGWNHKRISSKEAASRKKTFQLIYTDVLKKYHGEELCHQLESTIDLEGYFTWLAFNHLFQNGDYSDELYLMWNTSTNRFEIIPWDFDDLFHPQPHEGFEKRNTVLRDKLIYSSEDALDVAIAQDEFLYKKYLQQYQKLLNKLTSVAFAEILNNVYRDVYPYFQKPEIVSQSQYDQSGPTNLEKLETDLRDISTYINTRLAIYQKIVDEALK